MIIVPMINWIHKRKIVKQEFSWNNWARIKIKNIQKIVQTLKLLRKSPLTQYQLDITT